MKGTIFERGNKLSNKVSRFMAWTRVKKYWLFMPKKEYKQNLFFNFLGIMTFLAGLYAAVYFGILKIGEFIVWLTGYFSGRKAKKEGKEVEES